MHHVVRKENEKVANETPSLAATTSHACVHLCTIPYRIWCLLYRMLHATCRALQDPQHRGAWCTERVCEGQAWRSPLRVPFLHSTFSLPFSALGSVYEAVHAGRPVEIKRGHANARAMDPHSRVVDMWITSHTAPHTVCCMWTQHAPSCTQLCEALAPFFSPFFSPSLHSV